MCNSCKQLHFYSGFRTTLQYSHEIGKIRGLVSLGDMAVDSATAPLEQIDGNFRGYARHEVRCRCADSASRCGSIPRQAPEGSRRCEICVIK